jgi:hypothetical protein
MVARDTTDLLAINKKAFDLYIKDLIQEDFRKRTKFMSEITVFDPMQPRMSANQPKNTQHIQEMVKYMNVKKFLSQVDIIREGAQQPNGMFFIRSGNCRVTKTIAAGPIGEDGTRGQVDVESDIFGPKKYFGESCLETWETVDAAAGATGEPPSMDSIGRFFYTVTAINSVEVSTWFSFGAWSTACGSLCTSALLFALSSRCSTFLCMT